MNLKDILSKNFIGCHESREYENVVIYVAENCLEG